MGDYCCSTNSLASASLAELLRVITLMTGSGILPHFCGIFRTPSFWTSSPSGADAVSHPRCQATELGAASTEVWTNTSRRQYHVKTTTSTTKKKNVERGSTVRALCHRCVSPRLTELAPLAGGTCGAAHSFLTLLHGFLCKSDFLCRADSCEGLILV